MSKPQNMLQSALLEWGFGSGAAMVLGGSCCLDWLQAGHFHRRKMLLTAAWKHWSWHRCLVGSGRRRSWEVLPHLQLLWPLLVAQACKAPMYREALVLLRYWAPSKQRTPGISCGRIIWLKSSNLWYREAVLHHAAIHWSDFHRQKIYYWKVSVVNLSLL